MRANSWILGIFAGTAFCIAGLILLGIVVGESCGAIERTDYVGTLDEVFARHYPHVEAAKSAEDGATAVIEYPYGVCEDLPFQWERTLTLMAVFVVLSISGAVGARLGSTIRPARGAAASALAFLIVSILTAIENSNRSPLELSAFVTIAVITLTAGAIGYVGGYLVLIRVRKAEAAQVRARAP